MKILCKCKFGGFNVDFKLLSCVQLFVTPWTLAQQALLSIGFIKQEYWNGLPFPSSGDLPNPGIKPRSPALQGDPSLSEPPGKHNMHFQLELFLNQKYELFLPLK